MVVYTISEYIESQSSIKAKIDAIQSLIDSMLSKAIEAVDNSGTAEYLLDDGQVRIQTKYRSAVEVSKGIERLESILQMYINRHNGRATVLRGRLNY